MFNSLLSLLQARKLETHARVDETFATNGGVCTFDARYTRACTRTPTYNKRVEGRQKGDINFRHRVSRSLCVRRCAFCRSPLVNHVGAFLIYVCASPENAIGKSRGYAAERFERCLESERKRTFPDYSSATGEIAFQLPPRNHRTLSFIQSCAEIGRLEIA